jgi:hypothetical protein
MDKQKTSDDRVNPLRTQLMMMRFALLFIPLYLFILSPTCGIFGPYLWEITSLLRIAFFAVIPGILFSFLGVLGNSNPALGISAAVLTVIMMSNTVVTPFLTIFDFTLLLFFVEFSTTLNSVSGLVKTVRVGADENVSYNYKAAINAYVRRLLAVILITLSVSWAAAFFALNFVTQIGGSGIIILSIITLILVFGAIAARYTKR